MYFGNMMLGNKQGLVSGNAHVQVWGITVLATFLELLLTVV